MLGDDDFGFQPAFLACFIPAAGHLLISTREYTVVQTPKESDLSHNV